MDRLVGNWYVALEEKFQDKVSVFLDRKKVKSLSSKRPKLVSHIYEEWLERNFMVFLYKCYWFEILVVFKSNKARQKCDS